MVRKMNLQLLKTSKNVRTVVFYIFSGISGRKNVFPMRKLDANAPSGQSKTSHDAKTWRTTVNAGLMLTCIFVNFYLSLEYLNQLSTCLKALEHTEEFAASRGSFLLLFLDWWCLSFYYKNTLTWFMKSAVKLQLFIIIIKIRPDRSSIRLHRADRAGQEVTHKNGTKHRVNFQKT